MKAVRKLASQMGVRHLRQHGLRTTLTAAGVAAGVAMVFSIGTMNAVLVDAMHSTATAFVGRAALQVGASSPGGLSDSLPGVLAHVPGVTAAVPVLEVRSQMSGRRGSRGVFVLGVTPGIAAIAPLNETRARGAVGPSPDGQGVIVSRALADILGVSVGDSVGLEAPGGVVSERVTAIVSSAALDRINGGMVAMMSLPTAQTVFDRASRIDTVLIVAQSHTPIARLRVLHATRAEAGLGHVVEQLLDVGRRERGQPLVAHRRLDVQAHTLLVAAVGGVGAVGLHRLEPPVEERGHGDPGIRLLQPVVSEPRCLGQLAQCVALGLGPDHPPLPAPEAVSSELDRAAPQPVGLRYTDPSPFPRCPRLEPPAIRPL